MNIPHPIPRRYLAAIAAAAFARTAAADPPLIADGAPLDITPGTYETTGNSEYGLLAVNGGRAEGRDTHIVTSGKDAYAVRVAGSGSSVTLTGGSLHTTGVGSHGLVVRATQGTAASMDDVTIVTEGASAAGASFEQDGAHGQFLGGSIETGGYAAIGIHARDGGQFSLEDTSVLTKGDHAAGLIAAGDSSSLETKRGRIKTMGVESHGVFVDGHATATLADTTVTTAGASAYALNANAGSGLITVANSVFTTGGDNAIGVMVHDGARVVLRDTTIETSGLRAAGIDDRAASVGLQGARVITHGRSSYGVVAKGGDYPGKIPQIDIRSSTIATEGIHAYGAAASGGGRVTLTETDIKTTGANAHGLWNSLGDITSTRSNIEVSGKDAYGVLVLPGGNIRIDGGTVNSKQFAALGIADPGTVRIGGGAVLTGGNGWFAEVDPGSTKAFTVVLDQGASAIGGIRLSEQAGPLPPDETKLSLAIRNDARWSGASSIVRDLSLESGGTWAVTGDSRVSHLRNDHGIVDFAPAVAGSFATLTIAGDYEGNEGLFRMRGRLAGDASPADLVHVMGSTSGSSLIAVDALNGAGDHTYDGIPLVRVDGKSEGTFQLAGRAVAGAHEYFLHKGSLSQPDDGDWYLRSSLPEPPTVTPEKETPPDEPEDPYVPPVSVLRPETGTYRANQTAVLDMFTGGPGAGEDDERDDARRAVWARFDRHHTTFDLRDQIATTTSTNELTLGADLFRGGETTQAYAGVMAAAGQADTRGTSLLTRYSAKGRVRGVAAGVYAGMRTEDGTYLRGWTQYARFSQRVEGDGLQMERYSSRTLTGSIEAGHRWRTALSKETDVYLEPQAQILATRLRGGTHTEANGTRIATAHGSGVTSRLGMRTAARWQTPGGHVASPYVAASWLRRLGRLDATQFDGEAFAGGVPRNSYALKLGLTFLRRTGWSLWGDVETRFGARHYRRVAGTLGVRKAW